MLSLLYRLLLLLRRQLALLIHPLVAESSVLHLTSDLGPNPRWIWDDVVVEDLHGVLERDCKQ